MAVFVIHHLMKFMTSLSARFQVFYMTWIAIVVCIKLNRVGVAPVTRPPGTIPSGIPLVDSFFATPRPELKNRSFLEYLATFVAICVGMVCAVLIGCITHISGFISIPLTRGELMGVTFILGMGLLGVKSLD